MCSPLFCRFMKPIGFAFDYIKPFGFVSTMPYRENGRDLSQLSSNGSVVFYMAALLYVSLSTFDLVYVSSLLFSSSSEKFSPLRSPARL